MTRATCRRTLVVAVIAVAALVPSGRSDGAVEVPGTPVTWGSNPYGQLGTSGVDSRFSAGAVQGLGDVVDLDAGRGHAVALRIDGTVVAWGRNNFGQLGDGTTTDRSQPVAVAGLSHIVAVATGHYHSMALGADGTVYAWGFNADGQLGDGTDTHRTRPVEVSLDGVVAIAGGRDMSYALRSDGTVWAWGLNADGQLGDGSRVSKATPVRTRDLYGIVAISGGRDHGLAADEDGRVWAWGDNAYGQVGDGTLVDRLVPVSVAVADATQVAAGAHHSYALRSNGTIAAWGRNYRGQLGDGTTRLRRVPVTVTGITNAVDVAAGRDHGIAILDTATVRTWGWNDYGQLGDGTDTTRTTPVAVPGAEDAAIAGGGQDFSVALVQTGPGDTTAPSRPGRPSGVSSEPGTIDLAWAGATDDRWAVLTYAVERDGTPIGTVQSGDAVVRYRDDGVVLGTAHTYRVTAVDGSGNVSTPSPSSASIREMSPILEDGFDSGFESWTRVWRLALDGAVGRPAPSARASVADQKAFARLTLPQEESSVCASADVRLTAQGDRGVTLLRVRTADPSSVARLMVSPGGKLVLRSDVGRSQFNSGVELTGAWTRLSLCVFVDDDRLVASRDGVEIADWTVQLGTRLIGEFQLGESQKRTFDAVFDTVTVVPVD